MDQNNIKQELDDIKDLCRGLETKIDKVVSAISGDQLNPVGMIQRMQQMDAEVKILQQFKQESEKKVSYMKGLASITILATAIAVFQTIKSFFIGK